MRTIFLALALLLVPCVAVAADGDLCGATATVTGDSYMTTGNYYVICNALDDTHVAANDGVIEEFDMWSDGGNLIGAPTVVQISIQTATSCTDNPIVTALNFTNTASGTTYALAGHGLAAAGDSLVLEGNLASAYRFVSGTVGDTACATTGLDIVIYRYYLKRR